MLIALISTAIWDVPIRHEYYSWHLPPAASTDICNWHRVNDARALQQSLELLILSMIVPVGPEEDDPKRVNILTSCMQGALQDLMLHLAQAADADSEPCLHAIGFLACH